VESLVHRSNLGVLVAGLAGVGIYTTALMLLMQHASYDAWSTAIIGPLLIAVSLPILARQARRERDTGLLWILGSALALKLTAALVRYYVAFDVYGGVADAAGYDDWGVRISAAFRSGHFVSGLDSLSGTNLIRFLSGIVYTLIGPSRLGGFVVFSWFGFWGLFLFYRAFVIAVPAGRRLTYARFVFFIPSLLFWPSSIGKESFMTFAIGVTAFGAAGILTGRPWRGVAYAALGLSLAQVVRPHVAGLMALAIGGAFILRPSTVKRKELAPMAKGFAAAMLAVLALILVIRTDEFLRDSNIDTRRGLGGTLQAITQRSSGGGSTFQPSVLDSPLRMPLAFGTVLFRPILIEAHNAQALAAALEGTFLFVVSVIRWRWIVHAVRSIRRIPYVAFALFYSAGFIIAFSSVANFGILVRQRVQLFPLYLVLLSIPPPKVLAPPASRSTGNQLRASVRPRPSAS
jgi:hypothetical protein